jgi:hypothetical protein
MQEIRRAVRRLSEVVEQWIVKGTGGPITAMTWDLSKQYVIHDPKTDPDGQRAHSLVALGGDIFIEIGDGGYAGEMSWDLQHGARPLLRWQGDWTRGAGNFMTDGADMVWTYGEGKEPGKEGSYSYKKLSVMTAPYTTDPAEVAAKARRLRSDLSTMWVYPYGLGCGHAAHEVSEKGTSRDLLVVRLADGVSWLLKGAEGGTGLKYLFALGATCEEVFTTAEVNDIGMTILRIRLDSLGPGIPPD